MEAQQKGQSPDEQTPGDQDLVGEARLIQTRIEKVGRLRTQGIDPYPARFKPDTTTTAARDRLIALETRRTKAGRAAEGARTRAVTVAGRILARRGMGRAAFVDVQDGAGKMQLHIRKNVLSDSFSLMDELDIGDIIGATGPVFRTRQGEPSIEVRSLTVLCKAVRGLPDKWAGLQDVEKRYRQRYLDLITRERSVEIARSRAAILSAMRRFMESRDFIEVETPIMVGIPAGASAQPFATHHNALDRRLFLRIATELHLKRLVVGGLERVFEIGRIFRNEGMDADHNPEFTTMESYEAYADYNDVMEMVEQLVATVAREVTGGTIVPHPELDDETIDLTPPWPRLNLRKEIVKRTGIDFLECSDIATLSSAMRDREIHVEEGLTWGRLLDKVISAEVEPNLIQPCFLVDYPIAMSPLAKSKPGADGIVERFEAFAVGHELCNAFTELNDPVEQRARFEEQERLHTAFGDEEMDRLDEDFLVAMEHGMPPTGGLGIGVDRLAMLITGEQTIREVVLFPQLRTL